MSEEATTLEQMWMCSNPDEEPAVRVYRRSDVIKTHGKAGISEDGPRCFMALGCWWVDADKYDLYLTEQGQTRDIKDSVKVLEIMRGYTAAEIQEFSVLKREVEDCKVVLMAIEEILNFVTRT